MLVVIKIVFCFVCLLFFCLNQTLMRYQDVKTDALNRIFAGRPIKFIKEYDGSLSFL